MDGFEDVKYRRLRMTNVELEKENVIRWIKHMNLEDWYCVSMMIESIEAVSNQIFNCQRCKEEYGDCNHIDHEGVLCKERFIEHSKRDVL